MTANEHFRQDSTIEGLRNEFSACRRKLESKCEALLILSQELDQCRSEKDQFKLMAEQLQERYHVLKRSLSGQPLMTSTETGIDRKSVDSQSQNLLRLWCEAKELGKSLQFEVDDLKQKLFDAQGDIKLLREQIVRQRVGTTDEGMMTRHFPAHERETLVQKLESANEQNLQLEHDLKSLLDEKEELITERDVYKTKHERLNHELNNILKGDENRIVDIDALVMENKYLQERLKQMEEEKSMAVAAVSKYKSLLKKKKAKSSIKLGQNRGGGMIVTQKQVQYLLDTDQEMLHTPEAISDLHALSAALLDSVNDKNLALSHQRKTNKILANRVAELEKKIKTLELVGFWGVPESLSSNDLCSPTSNDGLFKLEDNTAHQASGNFKDNVSESESDSKSSPSPGSDDIFAKHDFDHRKDSENNLNYTKTCIADSQKDHNYITNEQGYFSEQCQFYENTNNVDDKSGTSENPDITEFGLLLDKVTKKMHTMTHNISETLEQSSVHLKNEKEFDVDNMETYADSSTPDNPLLKGKPESHGSITATDDTMHDVAGNASNDDVPHNVEC